MEQNINTQIANTNQSSITEVFNYLFKGKDAVISPEQTYDLFGLLLVIILVGLVGLIFFLPIGGWFWAGLLFTILIVSVSLSLFIPIRQYSSQIMTFFGLSAIWYLIVCLWLRKASEDNIENGPIYLNRIVRGYSQKR